MGAPSAPPAWGEQTPICPTPGCGTRGEPPRVTLPPFLLAVPIDATRGLKMLYVFVDIKIDTSHFLDTIRFNFAVGSSLALVSTIQFVAAVQVSSHDCVDGELCDNSDQCFTAAPLPSSPGSCSVNVRAGRGARGISVLCWGKLQQLCLSVCLLLSGDK